jgi:hypothetical protein
METKLTYTESGKKAIDEFLENQKEQFEKVVYDEKYSPEGDNIEITASDVKSYVDNRRKLKERKKLSLILEIYIILGIIMTAVGFLYPFFSEMIQYSPIQSVITIGGCCLILFGCFSWLHLYRKNKP